MTLYRNTYRIESTRLRDWDYRSRGWYFVTICAHNRRSIFGRIIDKEMQLSQIGSVAESELRSISTRYKNVLVDEHIVMPNYVHAIIMIDGDHCFTPSSKCSVTTYAAFESPRAGSLSAIVRSYKAGVTRKCHGLGIRQEIWQSRFHDHLLRGDRAISAVREYVCNNPANWVMDSENRS
jgi:REP-associated tyrosine transposase